MAGMSEILPNSFTFFLSFFRYMYFLEFNAKVPFFDPVKLKKEAEKAKILIRMFT